MLEFALLLMSASMNAYVIKKLEEKNPGKTTFTISKDDLTKLNAEASAQIIKQFIEAERQAKTEKESQPKSPEQLINEGLDMMNKEKESDHPDNA